MSEQGNRYGTMRVYLRQSLGYFPSGHGGDELAPHQGTSSEEQAPQPLVYRQPRRAERHAAELNYYYLKFYNEFTATYRLLFI